MIVKIVAPNASGSFSGLANYLTDDKKQHKDKVEEISFSNCMFKNTLENVKFIESSQSINHSKKDKTMHIIVSFQEDEKPSKEILNDIEKELLKSIGLENNHRLCVTHTNTNNYHFHLAISRIDPNTHKRLDPYQSRRKVQKKARELEEKHKLKRDNHGTLAEKKAHKSKTYTLQRKKDVKSTTRREKDRERSKPSTPTLHQSTHRSVGGVRQAQSLNDMPTLSRCNMVYQQPTIGEIKSLLQSDERHKLRFFQSRESRDSHRMRRSRTSSNKNDGARGVESQEHEVPLLTDEHIDEEFANYQSEHIDEEFANYQSEHIDEEFANYQSEHIDEEFANYQSEHIDEEFANYQSEHIDEEFANYQSEPSESKTTKKVKEQEMHSGLQSFLSWTKEEVLEDIQKVLEDPKSTLKDFHRVFAEYNLEVIERGNGIVIKDKTRKLFIKASDVHRDLSKGKIEKRFGAFRKIDIEVIKPKKQFGREKTEFWNHYQKEMEQNKINKKMQLDPIKEQYTKERDALYQSYKKKRELLKLNSNMNSIGKREIYSLYHASYKKELEVLKSRYSEDRNRIYQQYKYINFKEYLIREALKGDTKALQTLRTTKAPKPKKDENTLGNKTDHKIYISSEPKLTKRGYVVYKLDKENDQSKIIDKGNHIKISNASDEALLKALKIAQHKYGKALNITGDAKFKTKVISLVIEHKLDIGFKDKDMQKILESIDVSKKNKVKSEKGIEI